MKPLYAKTLILAQLMAISFMLGYCAKPDAVAAYDSEGMADIISLSEPIDQWEGK